jgi:hypothetical protein
MDKAFYEGDPFTRHKGKDALTEAAWNDEGLEKNVCNGSDPLDSSGIRFAKNPATRYGKS